MSPFTLEMVERLNPFFMSWNKSTQEIYVSTQLRQLWGLESQSSLGSDDIVIVRPKMGRLRFEWISELTDISIHISLERQFDKVIRGQFLEDCYRWVFVGSPYVFSIEDLHRVGMQIGDLPLHDSTGDLLIASETIRASFQETRGKARELEAMNDELSSANQLLAGLVPETLRHTLGLNLEDGEALSNRVVLVGQFIEKLQAAVEFRERFLATVSHELRTPLNAILGLSEALAEGVYGDLNERQQHSLETVFTSGEHLLSLINDVLEISKIESDGANLQISQTTASRLCETSRRMLLPLADKKGLELELIDATEDTVFDCDTRRIRQVLVNLIGNALKFTETGRITIQVSLVEHGDRVRFTVEDTGIGIAEEALPQLFLPFYQVQQELNRTYQGTGLGLAISKHTVLLHGGNIEVSSVVGEGSAFSFWLPRCASSVSNQAVALTSVEPDSEAKEFPFIACDLKAMTLLVVTLPDIDETPLIDYLQEQGTQVLHCTDPLEGLRSVLNGSVDGIITQSDLSDSTGTMGGLEFVSCVRALPTARNLPVIVLASDCREDSDEGRFHEVGSDAYVCRPFRMVDIVVRLCNLVDNARTLTKEGSI
jgi:signal transduction histidine kinase/CheY-like chemotaxis protein